MSQLHELAGLREAAIVARSKLDDDEAFRDVLSRAIHLLQVDEGDVAHEMGVSRSTVHRWKDGNAIPYRLMRKPLYAFVLRRINAIDAKARRAAEKPETK